PTEQSQTPRSRFPCTGPDERRRMTHPIHARTCWLTRRLSSMGLVVRSAQRPGSGAAGGRQPFVDRVQSARRRLHSEVRRLRNDIGDAPILQPHLHLGVWMFGNGARQRLFQASKHLTEQSVVGAFPELSFVSDVETGE